MSGAICDGVGWVYFNEDAGEEYAPNHPVKSGEVPDATRIRRSTAQEDVLWQAFQDAHDRAHALSTTPSQRLDAATVERCAQVAEQTNRDGWKARNDDIAAAIRALATEPHQHGGKGA